MAIIPNGKTRPRRRCPMCGFRPSGRAIKVNGRIRAAIMLSGERVAVLAARYGLTRQAIYQIKPGKRPRRHRRSSSNGKEVRR